MKNSDQAHSVKFKKPALNNFYADVKKRVDDYFKKKNISPYADSSLYIKSFFLVFLYLITYASIISDRFQLLGIMSLYGLLGITKSFIGFNLIHDALHGAYSSHKWINSTIGYLFDLNGTSSLIWKVSHNQHHHVYTNIPGHDDDINKAILLRLNPSDKIYWFHRYQHIYALFLYSLIGFNWIFYSDFAWFVKEYRNRNIKFKDLFLFLTFKALNLFLFLIFPLIYLSVPWWYVILGYTSMQVCAGVLIAIVFQLAHIVEKVKYFEPDSQGYVENNWVVHELLTTSNFATKSKLLTTLIGGLNFQIEHHLFPQISHVHYFEISKILKEATQEYGLPYNEQPTFLAAICSHFRTLKNLATMTF